MVTPIEPWATIRVHHDPAPPAPSSGEPLETLGLLLAEFDTVGGVEHRDQDTLGGPPHPELWVYTTPDELDELCARIMTLGHALGLGLGTEAQVHHDDDWRDSWKRFYQPQILGNGALLLRPSWIERRPGDPDLELVLDPGRAFGTGLHQSTRLCLDRLCTLWREGLRPARVLDLGCGSGILVLAAARLFDQAELWARDIDPEAVETTHENAVLNQVRPRIHLECGPVPKLDELPPLSLLVANIRPEVLIPAAPTLRTMLAPGGRIVLSGILSEESTEVRAAYEATGLLDVNSPDPIQGEWERVELRAP